MQKDKNQQDTNITRRNFLKKLTMTTVFTVPAIQSFKLMAQGYQQWTAHGHGHHYPPPPPPNGF
ncbi:MAG TPA: twin-arginine translocation signal domain-containing protein [Candidatus Marinimicrobia bacterium]|nr:twin-arginine translocation signal domain-containing protein [Candidatus Neomarinimicrobiota bacterium]